MTNVLSYGHEGNTYALFEHAAMPYSATERFGLDILLGRDMQRVDAFVAYIAERDAERWRAFLESQGATPTCDFPRLLLLGRDSLDELRGETAGVVNLETLARDLKIMGPRYRNLRLEEIRQKIPHLYEIMVELSEDVSLAPQ